MSFYAPPCEKGPPVPHTEQLPGAQGIVMLLLLLTLLQPPTPRAAGLPSTLPVRRFGGVTGA